MKITFNYTKLLLLVLMVTSCGHQRLIAQQPNILFVFSDDAGYADFGFQGSKDFKTPNLDALAASGIKFTQAYVSAAENPELVRELYKKLFQWEFTLERSLWKLKRLYEGKAAERMDIIENQKL